MISRMDCKKRMNFAYVLKFLAAYFYFQFHNKQKTDKIEYIYIWKRYWKVR